MQESDLGYQKDVTGSGKTVAGYAVLALLSIAAFSLVDFSSLANLELSAILLIVPGSLLGLIGRAYSAYIPLRAENIACPAREWLGLGVYTFLADQVLPLKSGLALRALYLKSRYDLAYTTFAGLQTGINHLALLTTAAFGLVLVLGRLDEHVRFVGPYASMLALLAIPLLMRPTTLRTNNRLLRGLANTYNSFNRLKCQPVILLRVFLATIVILGANVLAMYFALRSIDSPAGLYAAGLSVISIRLLSVVSITPGNLGVQEFVAAAVLSQLGATFDDGVLASLVARAVGAALSVAMAPFFTGILSELESRGRGSAV